MEVFKNLYGIDVLPREFLEFAGTGEANFLGSVAKKYSLPFDATSAKAAFFELYLERCASPSTNIAYEGKQHNSYVCYLDVCVCMVVVVVVVCACSLAVGRDADQKFLFQLAERYGGQVRTYDEQPSSFGHADDPPPLLFSYA